jgi:hypothetical protein
MRNRIIGFALLAMVSFPQAALGVGWLPPETLTSAGVTTSDVEIESSLNGALVLVSRQADGGFQRVFARERVPGGQWGAPVALSPGGTDAFDPDVSVGADGTAVAVWRQTDGTNDLIRASVRPPGGSWGAMETLSAAGQNAVLPAVSVDQAGTAVVVWSRFSGSIWEIQSSTRQAAGTWQTVVTMGTASPAPSDIDVAAASGRAAAVWIAQVSTDQRAVAAVREGSSGAWGVSTMMNMTLTSAASAEVGIAGDGTATVAFRHESSGVYDVRARTRPLAGAWDAGLVIGAADSLTTDIELEVHALGDVTVAWTRNDGTSRRVEAVTRSTGGAFSSPVLLSPFGIGASNPTLAFDGAGGVSAAWRQTEVGAEVVYVASRPPGLLWSPALKGATTKAVSGVPVITHTLGDIAAAWIGPSAATYELQAAVLDRTPPHPTLLAIPPATRVGDVTTFSAAFFDAWGLGPSGTRWSFGDNTFATGGVLSHTYQIPGTYSVRVETGDLVPNVFNHTQSVRVDPIAPGSGTAPATGVTQTTAYLHGTVWPNGQQTSYGFEYGTTTRYGLGTAKVTMTPIVGGHAVRRAVTGLTPGTTYHYRLVASAGGQTTRGPDRTLHTQPPVATVGAPGGGTVVPVPVSGVTPIRVRCRRACRGRVQLFAVVKGSHERGESSVEMRHRRRVRIGQKSFSASSGGSTTTRIELSSTGRSLLAASRRLSVLVVAIVRSSGKTSRTTTRITLVSSRKASKK